MHEYLDCILLPEELINDLCNKEIDEDVTRFLNLLEQFNKMLLKSKNPSIAKSRALEEVKPELEKLNFKVCSRTRNFLISKMNNFKSETNRLS